MGGDLLWESPNQKDTYMNQLSRGLAISRDKSNTLYLYYYNAYDNQTWQEVFTHKVIWPFDQVVLWSNMKIKYAIYALPQGLGPSNIARFIARKVSVFGVILVHIFPHSHWMRYSVRMRQNADQNNSENRHFLRSGYNLLWRGSTHKNTQPYILQPLGHVRSRSNLRKLILTTTDPMANTFGMVMIFLQWSRFIKFMNLYSNGLARSCDKLNKF